MEMEREKLCAELAETTETLPTSDGDSNPLEVAAVPDVKMLQESDVCKSWKDQLNMLKKEIEELQEDYDQSYLKIGKVLIKARDIYKGHGNWLQWLKENVPFTVRHAQRLIRVAEMFDNDNATSVSQLGLTASKAYALTRIGKNDVEGFIKIFSDRGGGQKTIKDMTRRELELEVTAFLRGKLASTNQGKIAADQGGGTSKGGVESNIKKLRDILGKTITSIKCSNLDTRDLWISELENICLTSLEELTSVSK